MAEAKREQSSPTLGAVVVVGMFSLLGAWHGVAALFGPAEANLGHRAITETAFFAALGWFMGATLAFARRGEPGTVITPESARVVYMWGCAMCLLHIAVAFHLGHGWSHQAAWEHTRQVGGYGDGIFVNYLFALVWLADVVWAWVAFDSYLNRSKWVGRAVYGFTGFVVFNASVVFATGFTRAVCALLFAALAVLVWKEWQRSRGERGA